MGPERANALKPSAVELEPVATSSASRPGDAVPSVASLYREHAAYVFRCLRALGVQDPDLPDVVQDVFLTVHRRVADIAIYLSVRAWIHGIAVRTAANYRRRACRKHERLFAEVPDTRGAGSEAPAALDLLRALSRLDDDQRAVFVLYELEELTMTEVAEALGCPVPTAYSRLYAARRRVRSAYAAPSPGRQVR